MKKTTLSIFLLLCFYYSNAQEVQQKKPIDSTLYKYVNGIQKIIETRILTEKKGQAIVNSLSRSVIIDGEGSIWIDSLYKYDIKDFKKISIIFYDNQEIIYGVQSRYGTLFLEKKEKKKN